MTRQTTEPLKRLTLTATNRQAIFFHELADHIDVNVPYQRGAVWTVDQRIALVYSWQMGLPIPAIVVNNRGNDEWAAQHGGEWGNWAVIDGKQRVQTAQMWFRSELAVPRSWFPAEDLSSEWTTTDDGPYVRFTDLSIPGKRRCSHRWLLPACEAQLMSVRDEARMFLILNGYGTTQTTDDMDRAQQIAAEGTR